MFEVLFFAVKAPLL